MTCTNCSAAVERVLHGLGGVRRANVALTLGEARVAYDPAFTDEANHRSWIPAGGWCLHSAATERIRCAADMKHAATVFCHTRQSILRTAWMHLKSGLLRLLSCGCHDRRGFSCVGLPMTLGCSGVVVYLFTMQSMPEPV